MSDGVPVANPGHPFGLAVTTKPGGRALRHFVTHQLVQSHGGRNTPWRNAGSGLGFGIGLPHREPAPPPILILHGTADELVPISQAKSLKDKLDSPGVPCVYRPVPGWPHTMDLIQRVSDYFKVTLNEFFERYVK